MFHKKSRPFSGYFVKFPLWFMFVSWQSIICQLSAVTSYSLSQSSGYQANSSNSPFVRWPHHDRTFGFAQTKSPLFLQPNGSIEVVSFEGDYHFDIHRIHQWIPILREYNPNLSWWYLTVFSIIQSSHFTMIPSCFNNPQPSFFKKIPRVHQNADDISTLFVYEIINS